MRIKRSFSRLTLMIAAALAAVYLVSTPAVRAEDAATIVITLKNDAFSPAEVKVTAGKTFVLKFVNQDAAAAEIEAKDFKIEKVVTGNGEIIARVAPQTPGRYLFVNEYKEETVKGFVVVE